MLRHLFVAIFAALLCSAVAAACSGSGQSQAIQPEPQPSVSQQQEDQPAAAPAPRQREQEQPQQQQQQQTQPEPQAQEQPQQEVAQEQQQEPLPKPPGPPNFVSLVLADEQEAADNVAFAQDEYRFSLVENAEGRSEPIALGTVAVEAVDGVGLAYVVRGVDFDIDASSGELFYTGRGEDFESRAERTTTVYAVPVDLPTLQLSWRAPSSIGSAPVDSYEYRWRQDGGHWTTAESDGREPVLIGPADNRSGYEAQVRAISAAGAGEWSRVVELSVAAAVAVEVVVAIVDQPEPPAQVRGLRIRAGDPSHEVIAAEWRVGSSTGGPRISGYEYRYRRGDRAWSTGETTARSTAVTVEGLHAETTYEFQVRAVNADGAGEWSESATITTAAAPYEPVVLSNQDGWVGRGVYYHAERDAFSDAVRTDVRIRGRERDLLLDAVCFDNGSTAVGFRLLNLEHDASFPDQLEVTWRIDSGPIENRTLDISLLGTTPGLYIHAWPAGPEFLSVVAGSPDDERLYVRIEYRGVQEDSFNLQTFRSSPVHQNLVRCGDY